MSAQPEPPVTADTSAASYAAALLDALGAVRIHQSTIWVTVATNRRPELAVWLRQRYGGSAVTHRRGATVSWTAAGRTAYRFISAAQPFLVIPLQQQRVALALEYYAGFDDQRGYRGVSPQERERREEIARRLTALDSLPSAHYRFSTPRA